MLSTGSGSLAADCHQRPAPVNWTHLLGPGAYVSFHQEGRRWKLLWRWSCWPFLSDGGHNPGQHHLLQKRSSLILTEWLHGFTVAGDLECLWLLCASVSTSHLRKRAAGEAQAELCSGRAIAPAAVPEQKILLVLFIGQQILLSLSRKSGCVSGCGNTEPNDEQGHMS